jgi:spore maturation protein CgeB
LGAPISALNRELLGFVRALAAGITHVWIDKGRWMRAETLEEIKLVTGAKLVHFTLDSQLLDNRSRLFNGAIPVYDCLITTKSFEVEAYRRLGAKRVLLTIQGFDERFFPREPSPTHIERYGSDVVFVGHCQPHYARLLRAVSDADVKLRIWGPGWARYARRHAWARPYVCGDGIWGDDYPIVLSCAKIGLGLLSKRIPETSTTRSFEIPASEILLLAERTDEHERLFTEGLEAEYFASESELIEKLRCYLASDAERVRIAKAGRGRCVRDRYACRETLKTLLSEIDGRTSNDDATRHIAT